MAAKLIPLVLAAAALLSGCLGDEGGDRAPRVRGGTAVVYASLPEHGVSAAAARAAEAGARLALDDAGGRAGELRIRLVTLTSTLPGERLWTPARVSSNAERAADDPRAIAYLGELDYGASAVSVPLTNEARLLQLSPGDALTSLTLIPPGRPRSDPRRLWPTGERNFARLVPTDLLQAETLVRRAAARGAERLAVVFDQEVYGRELAAQIVSRARRDGPEPVRSEEYRGRVDEIPDLVRGLAESSPDAVAYAGVAGPGSGRLMAAIDAQLPGVPVYATAGVLARDPAAPIPVAPAEVSALTPLLPAAELPASGRQVLRRVADAGGPRLARPEAAYGYESMRRILDAVERGGRDRGAVIRAALRAGRHGPTPLGSYLTRATGDVEGSRFALYELVDGRFRLTRMVG